MLKLLRTALNSARRALMIMVLLLSLALNAALVVSETLYMAVSNIAGAAMELISPSLRPTNHVASLTTALEQERIAKRKIQNELASAHTELIAERQISRKIKGEIAISQAQLAAERVTKQKLRQEFLNQGAQLAAERATLARAKVTTLRATSKIAAKLTAMAARETATAPAEAIPGYGAAVIAATLALDVADICTSIAGLVELQNIYEPNAAPLKNDLTVCGAKVPSKKEIYAFAISNPAAAVNSAIGSVPSLSDMKEINFSAIDWAFITNKMKQDTDSVLVAIANGTAKAASGLSDYAALKSSQIGNWMSE